MSDNDAPTQFSFAVLVLIWIVDLLLLLPKPSQASLEMMTAALAAPGM